MNQGVTYRLRVRRASDVVSVRLVQHMESVTYILGVRGGGDMVSVRLCSELRTTCTSWG